MNHRISRCKCIQISSSEISKHSANRTRHFHCSLYTVRWLETSENRFEERINIFVQGRVQKKHVWRGWRHRGWRWWRFCRESEIYEEWIVKRGVLISAPVSLPSFTDIASIYSNSTTYISRNKTFTQNLPCVFTSHIVHFQ